MNKPQAASYLVEVESAKAETEQSDADIEKFDCIVIGAGVAGGALGASLGRRGIRTLVLERDLTEPNRIVGELLQPAGVMKLGELGLLGWYHI